MEILKFLQEIMNNCKSFCENMDFVNEYITNKFNKEFKNG